LPIRIKIKVSDTLVTVFWDGYETSHIALLLTLYELARNQRVQQKLREEIQDAGDLTFDVLDNLPYLDQCIHGQIIKKKYRLLKQPLKIIKILEALRLNPALASFTRVCTETCEITDSKDQKIKIEKGTSCIVPIYSINYDETYYPEPENFYPERFDAEYGGIKKFRDNCWLAPFGDGPRICLGRANKFLKNSH
jgi:cytochrome P450